MWNGVGTPITTTPLKPLRKVSFRRQFWLYLILIARLASYVTLRTLPLAVHYCKVDSEGRECVIAFDSRQLKAAEKNYSVHDKELLAMKYALVKFQVHLLGSKPFAIYTDHASLRKATQSPHLLQKIARWLSFFAEYKFEVNYKPGKQNVLADVLSRRSDYELAHLTVVSSSVTDRIRLAYARDESCVAIIQALGSAEFENAKAKLSPRNRSKLHRYTRTVGLLYYSTGSDD
ncbi:unnamed protein product [Peronospora belbahrii]|uniref:Reverse transcriptase RNase H-like domain-containing protein n=1 Tax=Peronospora belbahrii TaxID=622444 RepID=A0AAU9L2G3_9STRA|nr:unnamed protein product [Peronospora belbahrii]